jgi:hypothetical protein
MKNIIFLSLLLISAVSYGQVHSISVADFVKIKNDKKKEALYFYENNWKVYRDSALKHKYIASYKLFTAKPDSVADFDIILITEYADSTQLKYSEDRFQKIIKQLRPNGPKLLNEFKPNDFRQNVFSKQAETILQSPIHANE